MTAPIITGYDSKYKSVWETKKGYESLNFENSYIAYIPEIKKAKNPMIYVISPNVITIILSLHKKKGGLLSSVTLNRLLQLILKNP